MVAVHIPRMAIWNRLRQELDRAGRVAQGALDEGRLRLELHRARQTADRFAERFGYAVYRSRESGQDLSAEDYAAHTANIKSAEAEVTRYEAMVNEASQRRKKGELPPGS
jgi:hypothetical protein